MYEMSKADGFDETEEKHNNGMCSEDVHVAENRERGDHIYNCKHIRRDVGHPTCKSGTLEESTHSKRECEE